MLSSAPLQAWAMRAVLTFRRDYLEPKRLRAEGSVCGESADAHMTKQPTADKMAESGGLVWFLKVDLVDFVGPAESERWVDWQIRAWRGAQAQLSACWGPLVAIVATTAVGWRDAPLASLRSMADRDCSLEILQRSRAGEGHVVLDRCGMSRGASSPALSGGQGQRHAPPEK